MIEQQEMEKASYAIDMRLNNLQAEILMDDEKKYWFEGVRDLIPQAIEKLPPAIKVGLFFEALNNKDEMDPTEQKDQLVGVLRAVGSIDKRTLPSGREVVVFDSYESGPWRIDKRLEQIARVTPDYQYFRTIPVPDLWPNDRAGFLLPVK